MSTFLRLTLLGLFGSAGVGLAVCVAMSSPELALAPAMPEPVASLHRSRPTPPAAPRRAAPVRQVSTAQLPQFPPSNQTAASPGQSGMAEIMEQVKPALKSMLQELAPDKLSNALQANVNQDQDEDQDQPTTPDEPADSSANEAPDRTVISVGDGEGNESIMMTIRGDDIRRVLEMLSEQGELNILASKNVQGTVSASLKGVSIETALNAILKSTGYQWRREGKFIYVGTPEDFLAMKQSDDSIGTRLYRPNYVKAEDLQTLIQPLLTQGVGTISITTAAETGIAPDGNSAGGDGFAGQEALLIRDYEAVLAQVDQVVEKVDRRPTQVQIHAMILSVRLDDSNELGVDFEILRDRNHIRLTSGTPLANLANIDINDGGLKVGFLDSSLALFINALETIGDTNVIATPRLMCLNKHRAEILIGSQLGYVSTTQTETSTTQSVEFLEVGTQLRIRPFISSDGLIRMEVHPELSTGNVSIQGNFTLPNKQLTQVTTNVMVRDGCTVILGGLLRDELVTSNSQIPLLGSLPVVGPAFRQQTETTERQEILVLLTPRIIYEPDSCCEGDDAANEFHHRQAIYADKMSPLGKRYLGRKYFRQAQNAWALGQGDKALRLINLAIHFDPLNRAAIDLRADIWEGNPVGDHTKPGSPLPFEAVSPLDGEQIAPWLLERMETPPGAAPLDHPFDPGRPGEQYDIVRPEPVP